MTSEPLNRTPATCAVCRKPESPDFRPFCSKRCADVDLGRWLKGGYIIPGGDAAPAKGPQETDNPEDDQD
ncbi:MAG: DNA gyrase inhibitor YacG [Alphaproteobacteria bacterium]